MPAQHSFFTRAATKLSWSARPSSSRFDPRLVGFVAQGGVVDDCAIEGIYGSKGVVDHFADQSEINGRCHHHTSTPAAAAEVSWVRNPAWVPPSKARAPTVPAATAVVILRLPGNFMLPGRFLVRHGGETLVIYRVPQELP